MNKIDLTDSGTLGEHGKRLTSGSAQFLQRGCATLMSLADSFQMPNLFSVGALDAAQGCGLFCLTRPRHREHLRRL
jgi:hypothetical protein